MNWFDRLFYLKNSTWIAIFKYYPIVFTLWILINMLGYWIYPVTNMFLGGCFVFSILSWKLSVDLYFCTWHRVLLLNQMIYLFLQMLNELNIQFNYYFYIALILNIIAILLSTFLYSRYGCFKRVENYKGFKYNYFGHKRWKDEVSK